MTHSEGSQRCFVTVDSGGWPEVEGCVGRRMHEGWGVVFGAFVD